MDAWTGLKPGPFSTKTVKELFIDGTVPTKIDDTKVGIDVDSATGNLWADGCLGPMATQGFLDLSGVDSAFPAWQKYDADWIKRAKQGTGVRGGPAKGTKSATTYFYQGGFQPYGPSWGAPFPPKDICTPEPTPAPSLPPEITPPPQDCPPGSVELNPDGTVVLGPDGQPIPCPDGQQNPPPETPAPETPAPETPVPAASL